MTLFFYLLLLADSSGWHCEADQRGLWHCAAPAPAVVAAPAPVSAPTPASAPAPVVAPAAVIVEDKYLLQVGAFRTPERAQRALVEFADGQVSIVPVRREGESWYLLLVGGYPDVAGARSAGSLWQELHPRADYWIRATDEIREMQRSGADDGPAQ